MIVDASVTIDAVVDPGPRRAAAREALAAQPPEERLEAPGHHAIEVVSGLRAAADHPLRPGDLAQALRDAEELGVHVEGTPWVDVHRARDLSQASLRHADAVYAAAAERRGTALLTADARIARSGAPIACQVVTVR